ncbi:MAG TPA: hypothetical protein VFD46_14615, partial [Chryseolinea sp.]|nr:hypothetical protein [Chryseolinea sp.]
AAYGDWKNVFSVWGNSLKSQAKLKSITFLGSLSLGIQKKKLSAGLYKNYLLILANEAKTRPLGAAVKYNAQAVLR